MNNARPVILALDQASASGYCIHHERLWLYGLARKATERRAAIHEALHAARSRNLKLLVVHEDHSGMPLLRGTKHDPNRRARPHFGELDHEVIRNTATILGMGAARGRWLEQLDLEGHPASWVTSVEPRVWRAKLIGGFGDTEAIKKRAIARASQTVGKRVEDHNVAEAVCIAEWAAFDGWARFCAERDIARAKRRAGSVAPFAGHTGGKVLGERPGRK